MGNFLANILIFDVYNIWYRVAWKNDELVKVGDKPTMINAICKFFELTDNYIKKYGTKDCRVFYLFDNAKTTVLKNRKLLDSEYKKTRKVQSDEFYKSLDIVELILKFYRDNSCVYRRQGLEADDFVLPIITEYAKEHDKIMMFSTDMDWSRGLLDDSEKDIKIVQYTTSNKIYTVKSFFDEFGFKPSIINITFWKCFYGDDSDNIIPTIPNYPKQYFLDCIKKYKHVSNFIHDALTNKIPYLDSGWKVKIKEVQERMMINWELISSADIAHNDLESWKVECSYKPNKLLIIYNSLNVVGRFDKRVGNQDKGSDIWSMLNGELLNRAE